MKLFWKTGEPYVLATGAALAIILVMSLTLIGTVMTNGLGYFWPRALVKFELKDGSSALGQIMQQEKNPLSGERRLQLKVGNRDIFGQDFRWIDEKEITTRSLPADAVLLERREHGNYFGMLKDVTAEGMALTAATPYDKLQQARKLVAGKIDDTGKIKKQMSDLNHAAESLRLKLQKLDYGGAEKNAAAIAELTTLREKKMAEFTKLNEQATATLAEIGKITAQMTDAAGGSKDISLTEIIALQRPNSMSFFAKSVA